MKGFNDFTFNEATMIQAVQFWLDAQFVRDPPQVRSINCSDSMSSKTFTVRVESKEVGKEA